MALYDDLPNTRTDIRERVIDYRLGRCEAAHDAFL